MFAFLQEIRTIPCSCLCGVLISDAGAFLRPRGLLNSALLPPPPPPLYIALQSMWPYLLSPPVREAGAGKEGSQKFKAKGRPMAEGGGPPLLWWVQQQRGLGGFETEWKGAPLICRASHEYIMGRGREGKRVKYFRWKVDGAREICLWRTYIISEHKIIWPRFF